MLHRCRKTRNPLFAKRGFSDEIINLSVRQYLRFKLSYRDLAQIMGELGVSVGALSTIIAGQGATEPRTITLDGFKPSHAALRRMGMRNEFNYRWENPVNIRSCQYLNNIVEQDHRRIKRRVQPMLGFKKFYNARRVIMGIELMQMLHKGQFRLAEV
jgi:transposase-like protein